MNQDVIDVLRKEEAELAAKLRAVRAVLDVYAPRAPQVNPAAVREPSQSHDETTVGIVTGKNGLSRGEYGRTVRAIARDVIGSTNGGVVATRDIVTAVEAKGIAIRGQSPLNAISALMSRSANFINVERLGWKLAENADHEDDDADDENGAPEGAPDAEEVGASSIESRSVSDLLG